MGLDGLPIRCQTDKNFFDHSRKAKIVLSFIGSLFLFNIKTTLFHKYFYTFAIWYRAKAMSRQKVQSIRKWQPWKGDLTGWCTAQAYETCYDDENHNHLIIDSTLALGGRKSALCTIVFKIGDEIRMGASHPLRLHLFLFGGTH